MCLQDIVGCTVRVYVRMSANCVGGLFLPQIGRYCWPLPTVVCNCGIFLHQLALILSLLV